MLPDGSSLDRDRAEQEARNCKAAVVIAKARIAELEIERDQARECCRVAHRTLDRLTPQSCDARVFNADVLEARIRSLGGHIQRQAEVLLLLEFERDQLRDEIAKAHRR